MESAGASLGKDVAGGRNASETLLSDLEGRSKRRKEDKGKGRAREEVETATASGRMEKVAGLEARLAEQSKTMSAQLEEQSKAVSTIIAIVEKLSQSARTAAGESSGTSDKENSASVAGRLLWREYRY